MLSICNASWVYVLAKRIDSNALVYLCIESFDVEAFSSRLLCKHEVVSNSMMIVLRTYSEWLLSCWKGQIDHLRHTHEFYIWDRQNRLIFSYGVMRDVAKKSCWYGKLLISYYSSADKFIINFCLWNCHFFLVACKLCRCVVITKMFTTELYIVYILLHFRPSFVPCYWHCI